MKNFESKWIGNKYNNNNYQPSISFYSLANFVTAISISGKKYTSETVTVTTLFL